MILRGRDRELAELRRAFDAAEGGAGSVVLLAGEPGIGKTRLADEIAAEATARGARVTWGRAWEAGGAPAYWPWIEALRPLAPLPATASDAERGRILHLARLLPELAASAPPPPAADPAQDRFRLGEAVATLLAAASRERPVVVLLDDLHAADIGSLALLHFVARSLRAARVLVVGTYRDVEARLSTDAGDALARIARESRYIALGRLGRDEVARWAASEGVDNGDALFATTEGNPLFVVETLRLVRARGGAAPAGRLPDGVRDVIRARLATLSAPARALLDAASVLGRTIDLGLAGMLVDRTLPEARDLAGEAVRSDVLVDTGDRTAFSHILIREVLYQELAATRRAELHARVARVLLDRHADDADTSLAEAVHHLFAAGPLVDADAAIAWARRGATRALRRLAFDEAAQLLAHAIDALPAGRDPERCDLLLELAAAQIGAGLATRGRETALAAAAIARRSGDAERLAQAALGYGTVFLFAVVDRVLIGLLEDAVASLPAGESPLRARLLGRLAAATQPAPDPGPPIELALEAIAMARRVADEATQVEVLVAGTSAMSYFADPRERLAVDTELVTIATRVGDRVAVLRGLQRVVFDHLESGDVTAADRAIDEYDRLSRAVDLPALRWRAPMLRATRAVMEGRFDASEALCAEAASIGARIDDGNLPLSLALHQAGRLSAARRHDALAAHLPSTLELLTRVADPIYLRAFRAGMLARVGRGDDARDDLAFLVGHDPPLRGRPMLAWAAEACLALGDRDAAATLVRLLEPVADRRHCWGALAMIVEGPIADLVAKLETLRGARPAVARTAPPRFEMCRDGDGWTIRADTTFHLRDSRGLQILARLVGEPGREVHVTDLVAPAGEPGHVEDAGDVLDARAIAAYKQRLADLREVEAEAESHDDPTRAARARAEIDALATELARGVGLGGRGRKASSTAEKARVNVRQRLLDAMTRIGEHSPALAKHLRQSIRTGTFCCYDP